MGKENDSENCVCVNFCQAFCYRCCWFVRREHISDKNHGFYQTHTQTSIHSVRSYTLHMNVRNQMKRRRNNSKHIQHSKKRKEKQKKIDISIRDEYRWVGKEKSTNARTYTVRYSSDTHAHTYMLSGWVQYFKKKSIFFPYHAKSLNYVIQIQCVALTNGFCCFNIHTNTRFPMIHTAMVCHTYTTIFHVQTHCLME